MPSLQGGAVQCWGRNFYGQLGKGDTSGKEGSPQTVTGLSGIGTIPHSGGEWHTCALIQGGAVQCWGSNSSGQLGNGDTGGKEGSPQTVTGLSGTVQSLTVGDWHTCALIQGGAVQCWGLNSYGQLGNGNTSGGTPSNCHWTEWKGTIPHSGGVRTPVPSFRGWSLQRWGAPHLRAHLHASTAGGTGMVSSGTGIHPQEGSPQTVTGLSGQPLRYNPSQRGSWHTCALIQGGAVQCWGSNFYGQLGNGNTSGGTPQTVTGLSGKVQSLTAGERFTPVPSFRVVLFSAGETILLVSSGTGIYIRGGAWQPSNCHWTEWKGTIPHSGGVAHLCPHSGWCCSVLGEQFLWSAREREYIRRNPSNCHWTEWNGTIPHSGG